METEEPTFGEWLRDRLSAIGMSQAELARQTGRSTGNVSDWISGKKRPEGDSVVLIAQALNYPVQYVLHALGYPVELPRGSDAYEYERQQREFQRSIEQLLNAQRVRAADDDDLIPVRFYGAVPFDVSVWARRAEGVGMQRVDREWLGTRSPEDFLVIQPGSPRFGASHLIASTDYLLIERSDESLVMNGDLVLVRVGTTIDLGIWRREGDWITLGNGAEPDRRISILEDYAVMGRYTGRMWR